MINIWKFKVAHRKCDQGVFIIVACHPAVLGNCIWTAPKLVKIDTQNCILMQDSYFKAFDLNIFSFHISLVYNMYNISVNFRCFGFLFFKSSMSFLMLWGEEG